MHCRYTLHDGTQSLTKKTAGLKTATGQQSAIRHIMAHKGSCLYRAETAEWGKKKSFRIPAVRDTKG